MSPSNGVTFDSLLHLDLLKEEMNNQTLNGYVRWMGLAQK